jgi:hypothetical protein
MPISGKPEIGGGGMTSSMLAVIKGDAPVGVSPEAPVWPPSG